MQKVKDTASANSKESAKENEGNKTKGGKDKAPEKPPKGKPTADSKKGTCQWPCNLVPTNVPGPEEAQAVLHPRKDVFVLKVAKIGANGDRRCKMELELVTPKGPEKKALCRIETRETQCDPDPPPCYCCGNRRRRNK